MILTPGSTIVFICSRLAGKKRLLYEQYARKLCRYAINQGCIPIAPHLFLPQFLNDDDPAERELGITAGKGIMHLCDELWYGSAWGISEGMKGDLLYAQDLPIDIFELIVDPEKEFIRLQK